MAENEKKQKPEKVFRAGGVVASVWKNIQKKDGKEFEVYSIAIERTFKDGEEFKRTSNMKINDLPKVVLVSNLAYRYLVLREDKGE